MAINRVLYHYKGDRCEQCGKSLEDVVREFGTANLSFEFNHIDPSQKADDYNKLIQRKLSSAQLDEVDKCSLLCVACHKVLTAQNDSVLLTVTFRVDGNEITHRLKCQTITNLEKQEVTFFSDQSDSLFLLRVKLGSTEARIFTALQLKEMQLLEGFIQQTTSGSNLSIETLEGFPLFTVKKRDAELFEFSQSADFPIVAHHMKFHPSLDVFIRNGQIIFSTSKSKPAHIGRGLGSIRIRGTAKYAASDQVESFEIESPDPLLRRDAYE